MTTNYERIKNMSIEEMSAYFENWDFVGVLFQNLDSMKQWLSQEVEE